MNCQGAIERLGEHLDGMLPQAEAAELEGHLASCAACRAELEELRRALDAVKALPRVRAPHGFAASVMAEIRTETAVASERPARVTPIRSATVFLRLAASIAAVCLVWFGVRALQVDPATGPTAGIGAKAEPLTRERETSELARLKATGKVAPAKTYEESRDVLLAAGKGSPEAPAAGSSVAPAPAAPRDAVAAPPDLAARRGANGATDKDTWRGQPDEAAQALAVQRITVYSNDVAVDTSQLKKLLSESGYTYSTQKKAILVRVPASEASRLLASLGSMPGGFRAADRQSLEALDKMKKSEDQAPKADKGQQAGAGEGGLTADADDLKEALRKHIDESRREIQKQEEGKKANADQKAKAPASDPDAPGVTAGAGGGKSREDESKRKAGMGAKDGGVAKGDDDHESEEGLGAALEPGNAPAGPSVAGGRPPAESEKKAQTKEAESSANGLHDKKKEHGDAKSETGGTDDVDGRTRNEKELGDKLSDELKKLESERKLADAEDAVVIYIEFEEPAEGAKPAAK